jgi:hypothetical protein
VVKQREKVQGLEERGKVGGVGSDEGLEERECVDDERKSRGLGNAGETKAAKIGRKEIGEDKIRVGNARIQKPEEKFIKGWFDKMIGVSEMRRNLGALGRNKGWIWILGRADGYGVAAAACLACEQIRDWLIMSIHSLKYSDRYGLKSGSPKTQSS